MTVRLIIIIMISTCCSADLNFLSFITKFYDSNVKSFRNFFNLNKGHSAASVFMYDNEINDNVHEIDNTYWMNYLRKEDVYGVRFYANIGVTFILKHFIREFGQIDLLGTYNLCV